MLGATGAGRFQGPSGSQHHHHQQQQQLHPLQPPPPSPSTTSTAPSSSASTNQRCTTTALWPPPLIQSHPTHQPPLQPLYHPQLHQLQHHQLLLPAALQTQQQQQQQPVQQQQLQQQQSLDTTCSTSSSTNRTVIDLHANGEITETLFSHPGGYPTPSSPFVNVSPLELVAKNFHAAGSLSFSQANSIFVQSDYIGATSSVATKKTCFGTWEQGLEPLHIQIKREPCQVSEITTSHPHLASHPSSSSSSHPQTACVVKIEQPSPKQNGCTPIASSGQHQHELVTTIMDSHHHQQMSATMNNGLGAGAAAAAAGVIPVGIAVARQRPLDHASIQPQLAQQTHLGGSGKDQLNRFGTADFGSSATSAFSQNNMFFANTAASTMLPSMFPTDALTMGVSNIHNSLRNGPPTLWQYPTSLSIESMMPMPMLPAGLQLVRDPSSGQIMVIPAASTIDPFQQAVVWPSYTQPTTLQAPHHLLVPNPMTQSMQQQQQAPPPPLPPLHMLNSDYLGSTTLHQHTQTHSTRLVALTGGGGGSGSGGAGGGCGAGINLGVDMKRHHKQTIPNNIPLPMQPTTLIKIEDCSSSTNHHHMSTAAATASSSTHLLHQHRPPQSMFDPCHSNAMQQHTSSTITTAVQSNDMVPTDLSASHHQLFYQADGNLIQIAPHNGTGMLDLSMTRPNPSPMTITRCLVTPETPPDSDNMCVNVNAAIPDVQDANIQTDTLSEDDNTIGTEDSHSYPTDFTQRLPPSQTNFEINNHNHIESVAVPAIELPPSNYILNPCTKLEISFGTQTTTEYSQEIITDLILPAPVLAQAQHYEPVPVVHAEPVRLEPEPEPVEQIIRPAEHNHDPNPTTIPHRGPDISGLELLSNSIEAFEKHIFIKKEPGLEVSKENYASEPQLELILSQQPHQLLQLSELTEQPPPIDIPANNGVSVPTHGGLDILCALAEQRFQEEVGSMRSSRKRSSSSDASESKKLRKHHKEKHSSRKSSKRSKHRKERRDRKSRSHDASDDDELVKQDLSESFNRVKASMCRASCHKNGAGSSAEGCCKEKCNWPTAEEVYIAMDSDMRNRLAQTAKEFLEEKRKLTEIKLLDKTLLASEKADSPLRSLSSVSDSNPFDSVKAVSDTESFAAYRFDDAETNSSGSSKRKSDSGAPELDVIANKKVKSLVEYIFASKNRGPLTPDQTSILDESSLQSSASIKQEVGDHEDKNGVDLFGGSSEKQRKSKHSLKHKKAKSSKDRKHRRSYEIRERKRRIDAMCTLTGEHLDGLEDKSNTRVLTAMGGLFYAGCLSAVQPPDVYAVTLDGERGNRPHIMSREEILRDAILEVVPTSVDEVLPGARLCAYWSQQYRCLYPGTAAPQDADSDPKFIVVEFDDGDSGRIAIDDIRFLLSEYPIVEYDPNPLLSLNKRNKQRGSQGELDTKPDCGVSSNNCFRIQDPKEPAMLESSKEAANKERRRLKKLRKDQLKQQQPLLQQQLVHSNQVSDNTTTPDLESKKHRHKYKCGDDFCKHRKHKKRRKHHKNKHNHRDESSQDGEEEVAKQSNDEDEEEEEEEDYEEDADDEEPVVAVSPVVSIINRKSNEGFYPSVKEETMTENEDASSNTNESTGSSYRSVGVTSSSAATNADKISTLALERQTSAENNSKIAAFLPARQLWAWSGKGVKRGNARGRVKKQFFKAIQRGKETISIGDSAVFLSTGRPDRPYIGRIESFWETTANNRVVRVKWYYHPEETVGCPELMFPGGLFQSPHADENDVQTISHKCQVKQFDEYVVKFGTDPTKYGAVYDNNDTFYVAGYYDPTAEQLNLESHIPKTEQTDDADH